MTGWPAGQRAACHAGLETGHVLCADETTSQAIAARVTPDGPSDLKMARRPVRGDTRTRADFTTPLAFGFQTEASKQTSNWRRRHDRC